VVDTVDVGKNKTYTWFFNPEPRINVEYAVTGTSSLKASYTRTTQFIQVLSNSVSPFTSLEVWVPSGPNIKPQKADQGIAGIFLQCVPFKAELFSGRLLQDVP